MKFKILLLATLGVGAFPAGAQDIPPALARCASVSDAQARLSCYDGIAGTKQAAKPAPQQAAVPTPAPPAPAPMIAPAVSKVTTFGAETMRKPELPPDAPEDVEEIKATVTQVQFSMTNRFTVTLDNGQVWRQIEADSTKARFHKSGDKVTIAHGLLGSYNLTLDGHEFVLFKVRRVR